MESEESSRAYDGFCLEKFFKTVAPGFTPVARLAISAERSNVAETGSVDVDIPAAVAITKVVE